MTSGTARLGSRLRQVASGLDQLPRPGCGHTWSRFELLADLAAEDLALARLAEGHVDALAILAESGAGAPDSGVVYGVWAARGGSGGLVAEVTGDGWRLSGQKPFCSGSGLIDRALVTAEAPDGYRLFDVEVTTSVRADPGSWPAVGMADSVSATVSFPGVVVDQSAAVGRPGFYLDRPGFWSGACGVAACWYGGARGLLVGVLDGLGDAPGELVLLELGRTVGALDAMSGLLHQAARDIDDEAGGWSETAGRRARSLRQCVHDLCQSVLVHTAAAGGARPLCHDGNQARRAADLYVYLAQHHGDADAVHLGRMAVDGHRCPSS
jgi:alkylation response protein AidB-like acyl-CoA dehydrogenase